MAQNPAAGGNPSGFNANQVAPVTGANPGVLGSVGGSGNPIMAPFPNGQSWPGVSSPYSFPANGSGAGVLPGGVGAGSSAGMFGGHGEDIARGLRDSGVPSNIASSLAAFLKSGAGYNPQVLQSIFAALQPQVNRGEADIMEHFGSMGLGMSSPAAIGMGDFLSQVNLNEGQIATQLYEQSVQNYMDILSGRQSQDHPGFWEGLGESLLGGVLGGISGGATSKFVNTYLGQQGSKGQGGSGGMDMAGMSELLLGSGAI